MNLRSLKRASRKKAARESVNTRREAAQSGLVAGAGARRTCHSWHQAVALRERRVAQYLSRMLRSLHGNGYRFTQFANPPPQACVTAVIENLISYNVYCLGPLDWPPVPLFPSGAFVIVIYLYLACLTL
jgi:hypothetical protein